VRFPSFDGLEIPAIYYRPHQASLENPAPALVWVHGGPGGQSRQNFSASLQYLVNHGYAILAVNNRGSSGYGKTFYQLDDQNHGDKDLKDCVAGKDWLAAQPEIDGEKIGILGGSYGGYMTMAALTYTPDAFQVGVNLFGVTNWIRTLRSIPPWWESYKEALYTELGDPNSADSVRLRAISPLFHTDKVTKPLIVLQGSQDPRVLQVESDEIVAGVRANGVPVEYVLFEDEGHGFVKKENQIKAYSSILNFLETHLKGEATVPIRDGALEQPELKK
jgi:dipeptidyl aminopeptidase/acylaminoacyl peptidase